MSRKFELPNTATSLRVVPEDKLDLRPEAQIIEEFHSFRPVTSEKNVWCFWDKGFDRMYPSYQHTVVNWVRKLGSSWTVRIIDLVDGSPNNVYEYAGKEWFPDCFVNRTMDGKHAPQHAADLVRLPLLFEHGGVWMDVGNMLHTHLDDLFWNPLTAPNQSYEMAVWIINGQIRKKWGSFGNYMLAARKGCVFIKNWHNSYKELWRGRTNAVDFHKSPLIQEIGLAEGVADWHSKDEVLRMSDYVAHMLLGDRTKNLFDVKTGWNGREFWENKVLMIEGIFNGVLGAILTGFHGYQQAEIFTTPLNDPDEDKRRKAEQFMLEVLQNSHMYKVYHNPAGGPLALGDVVKLEGSQDVDHRPGTFGELYRYATVHWESTRTVEFLEPQPTDDELIRATPTTTMAQEA